MQLECGGVCPIIASWSLCILVLKCCKCSYGLCGVEPLYKQVFSYIILGISVWYRNWMCFLLFLLSLIMLRFNVTCKTTPSFFFFCHILLFIHVMIQYLLQQLWYAKLCHTPHSCLISCHFNTCLGYITESSLWN